MSLKASVASNLAKYGTGYVIRRAALSNPGQPWKGTPGAATYTACTASERGFKPSEIKGGILENDVLITIDVASSTVEPKLGDRIGLGVLPVTDDTAIAWRDVVNVNVRRVAGVATVYKIQARR